MMNIRNVTARDIPAWRALSAEYDRYVLELSGDLDRWYDGGGDSPAFCDYMNAKIAQSEAILCADDDGRCMGIAAFSARNNRITFFAVSHGEDFFAAGGALLGFCISRLNASRDIHINALAGDADWISQHRQLYEEFGFSPSGDALENGMPVNVFRLNAQRK